MNTRTEFLGSITKKDDKAFRIAKVLILGHLAIVECDVFPFTWKTHMKGSPEYIRLDNEYFSLNPIYNWQPVDAKGNIVHLFDLVNVYDDKNTYIGYSIVFGGVQTKPDFGRFRLEEWGYPVPNKQVIIKYDKEF